MLMSEKEIDEQKRTLATLRHTLPRMPYSEFIAEAPPGAESPYFLNIRGSTGTGKSTIPMHITMQGAGSPYDLVIITDDETDDEILTYSEFHKLLILGRYYTKCGGLDVITFHDKRRVYEVLHRVWHETRLNILMEGMTVSSSYAWWLDRFTALAGDNPHDRELLIMSLWLPIEDIRARVMRRNGGREIKLDIARQKQDMILRNSEKFRLAGFNAWSTTTATVDYHDMLDWYAGELETNRRRMP